MWQWRRLPWARGLAIFAAVGIAVVYPNWVYNRGNCMAYQFGVTLWLAPWTWSPYEVKRGSDNCA